METAANSIMDYYARISERYYLARIYTSGTKTQIKYLWQPMATGVKVPGYEQFDLFIYREKGTLYLVESLTGAVILYQSKVNKRDFIKALPELLDKKGGISEMNILIVDHLCNNDQQPSPRYKKTGI